MVSMAAQLVPDCGPAIAAAQARCHQAPWMGIQPLGPICSVPPAAAAAAAGAKGGASQAHGSRHMYCTPLERPGAGAAAGGMPIKAEPQPWAARGPGSPSDSGAATATVAPFAGTAAAAAQAHPLAPLRTGSPSTSDEAALTQLAGLTGGSQGSAATPLSGRTPPPLQTQPSLPGSPVSSATQGHASATALANSPQSAPHEQLQGLQGSPVLAQGSPSAALDAARACAASRPLSRLAVASSVDSPMPEAAAAYAADLTMVQPAAATGTGSAAGCPPHDASAAAWMPVGAGMLSAGGRPAAAGSPTSPAENSGEGAEEVEAVGRDSKGRKRKVPDWLQGTVMYGDSKKLLGGGHKVRLVFGLLSQAV